MQNVFNERIKEIDQSIKWWTARYEEAESLGYKGYCKGQAAGLKEAREYVERLINAYNIYHYEGDEDANTSESGSFLDVSV